MGRPSAGRRWAVVAAGLVLLGALPTVVAALPADDTDLSAAALLDRVRASAGVAYQGYAESDARLALPEVPGVGRVLDLLSETTNLRVWWRSDTEWRVDAVSPIGEEDEYADPAGLWRWDSFEREATRVEGRPQVRLVRPADLLPPELGRRMAAAADPAKARRIGAKRVAGRAAAGVRVRPDDPDTTIVQVDLWVDPDSGLPLEVAVTARDTTAPAVQSRFLDLSLTPPGPAVTRFRPPRDADVDFTVAADLASLVDQFSPFVVPDSVDGRPLRGRVGRGGAGTYGEGYALVAVLAMERRRVDRAINRIDPLDPALLPRGFDRATYVETPLLTGLLVTRGDVGYALAGPVPLRVLVEAAESLT